MSNLGSSPSLPERFYGVWLLTGTMWVIELLDWITPWFALDRFGIQPRSLMGLIGVAASPLLHSSWSHLIANTPPFLILGSLVALRGLSAFWQVTVGCVVLSGLGTWLISPSYTITVGASGVVFGYFGYLLLRGLLERRASSIFISLAVGLCYGSILFQLFSTERGVSWSAHFCGLVGGVVIALFLHRRTPTRSH